MHGKLQPKPHVLEQAVAGTVAQRGLGHIERTLVIAPVSEQAGKGEPVAGRVRVALERQLEQLLRLGLIAVRERELATQVRQVEGQLEVLVRRFLSATEQLARVLQSLDVEHHEGGARERPRIVRCELHRLPGKVGRLLAVLHHVSLGGAGHHLRLAAVAGEGVAHERQVLLVPTSSAELRGTGQCLAEIVGHALAACVLE